VRVEVLDETGRFRSHELLVRTLASLADELGVAPEREVTVVLVGDDAMAERNAAHRGARGPTDVLAYPTGEPDDIGFPLVPSLGDIVIGLDTAERQARAQGHDVVRETLVLGAHALVHLLGHDHTDAEAWAPFTAAQQRVLELADDAADGAIHG
jgi:probable rRNA maturation factor